MGVRREEGKKIGGKKESDERLLCDSLFSVCRHCAVHCSLEHWLKVAAAAAAVKRIKIKNGSFLKTVYLSVCGREILFVALSIINVFCPLLCTAAAVAAAECHFVAIEFPSLRFFAAVVKVQHNHRCGNWSEVLAAAAAASFAAQRYLGLFLRSRST